MEAAALMLAEAPLLGRSRETLAFGMRSFPVGNYLLFYVPAKRGITVVRVLSGYRDLDSLFASPNRTEK
jgi:toxin ParE1/3/4